MDSYFTMFPFLKKREDQEISARGRIKILDKCLSANGTYIDVNVCSNGSDGKQYFEVWGYFRSLGLNQL